MRLSFATRHYDIPDDIREYAEKKLSHLERFFDRMLYELPEPTSIVILDFAVEEPVSESLLV